MRALCFPEELLSTSASASFEAVGARARASGQDGGFRIMIDHMRGDVRVDARGCRRAAMSRAWPFGTERDQIDANEATVVTERVLVPPANALVAFEWEAARPLDLRLEVRLDGGLEASLYPVPLQEGAALLRLDAGSSARLVVRRPDEGRADVEALAATAFARARRRAANRPSLLLRQSAPADEAGSNVAPGSPGDAELFVGLEHSIRMSLRSAQSGTLAAIALLGLNDRQLAGERLDGESDPTRLAALAGAWAAWTGDAGALESHRSTLVDWLITDLSRAERDAGGVEDPWSRTARALGAPVAELLGDAGLVARVRSGRAPDGAAALRDLAAAHATDDAAAAQVLTLFHDDLGILPDAARGRVRMAPRLEGRSVGLSRLVVGDTSFTLDATVTPGARACCRVEQTAGPTPYTIILEPWIRARSFDGAWVDGVRAELDAPREGTGFRPRVQLVADHAREIVLEFG